MDTVKWAHSTDMEPDDVMVSDNLLDFVKDDDIVTGLETHDDILQQDIFNEIINKFDFNDNEVNINTFLNDLNAADNSPVDEFIAKIEDPLLSSSNASIDYSEFTTATARLQSKPKIQVQPTQTIPTTTTQLQQIISPGVTHITTAEITSQLETVVYQIANSPISSNSFVTTASPMQSQQTVLPIQMVFNNVESSNFQPAQKFTEVIETSPIVVQSSKLLTNTTAVNNVVESNGKSIILSPAVVYTGATPVSTSSMQSVQLINTTNGAILTQVPMSTIMVEQEHERPPKVKEVKRSTHNAIERRYRTSINDKIVELKTMLVGEDGKLNKSAILKRSIEKIHDLETENYELRLQNARLRELLLAQGPITTDESSLKTLLLQKTVNPHKRRYTQSSIGSGSEYGNTSPPTSDESNPSLSPTHSDGSMPMSPLGNDEISTEIERSAKRNKKTRMENITTHGMSSMSKLTLCAFMFAIITINPLASLLSDSSSHTANSFFDDAASASRRTILGIDAENINYFQSIWFKFSNSFLALILNIILLTGCLVKLCYHSDPIMNFRSPAADKYFQQKLIADTEFDQGNASAAFIAYEKCLQMFGVTLPQSWFDLFPMTIWQFLRCCVHRLRFGQWLSRKFGRIICSDETQKDALNSAQELAIILNRCNQIHLSQNIGNGCGLILSMYAVNMAEVARNIAPLTLIDVYLTAALRCRKNYVYFFSWICSRYYLYKARNEASLLCGQKFPPKYNWIFNNAYGYKFICKFSFDTISSDSRTSLFTSEINPLDTLSIVFACYNEHLLKYALQCLVGISYTSNSDIKSLECNDATVIRDVLNYANLIKENCEDPLTIWWASLFSIDACWLLGDDTMADKLFEHVRKMPKALRESKDPLARTAVTVFCAKKLLAMKQNSQSGRKIWSLCNCASKMFTESLVYNKTAKNDMILFVQLLLCDWLLETRTSCWEMEQSSKEYPANDDNNNQVLCNPLPSKELEQFQADLNSLHCIVDYIPTAKSRVYLYEAVSRLMAGASPGHTQELLDRSFHEQYRRNNRSTFHCGSGSKETQNNSANETSSAVNKRRCGQASTVSVDGERERAAAMYVACKYLPTQLLCLPGERAGMLAEAAKTLKKIGNRKRLNDCYQLMQSFRTTTVPTDCN